MLDSSDRLKCRNEHIKVRIKVLEDKIPFLRPHGRWPSLDAVRRNQNGKSSSPASGKSTLPPAGYQPRIQNANEGLSNPKTKSTKLNDAGLATRPLLVAAPLSQSNIQNAGEKSSILKFQSEKKDTKGIPPNLAEFSFPIAGHRKYTKFPQFLRLPAE
jgi:hypothetical protein